MKREEGIPLKSVKIYNDVYDLGITQTDLDNLQKYHNMFLNKSMTYVLAAANKEKDLVLDFTKQGEPKLYVQDKDNFAAASGYRVFYGKNKRYYFRFVPNEVDVPYLEDLCEIKNTEQVSFVFNSMTELRAHMLSKDLRLLTQKARPLEITDVQMLYWVAGNLDKFKRNLYKAHKRYEDMPDYVKYIIDVLQLEDDTRVAIYVEHAKDKSGYGYRYFASNGHDDDDADNVIPGMKLRLYIIKPDGKAYNWTDPGQYFSHIDKITGAGRVYYPGESPMFPPEKAMSKYARGQKLTVIEDTTLQSIARRHVREEIEQEAMQRAMQTLSTKMKARVDALSEGKEFVFNDVTFRKNNFEYAGQVISTDNFETADVIRGLISNLSDDRFNFEQILDTFCDIFVKRVAGARPDSDNGSCVIGDIPIKLSRTDRTNVNGIVQGAYYVNGIRINKEELKDVLVRSLCYTKQADFEQFLHSVSLCSLKYHRVISSGIVIRLQDSLIQTTVEFKIGLERDKNKNYISFGDGERFLVRDTNRLLTMFNAEDMTRVINLLLDPTVVGLSGEQIHKIVDKGKRELQEERNKHTIMLNRAVQMFNCQKVEEVLMDNGRVVSGYTVKGKLREYLIDDSSLKVFEYPSGRYLCMVDKGQNEYANIPRLVSRMFALANDSKLANEIYTLQTAQQ